MKIKELINTLNQYDKDCEILIAYNTGYDIGTIYEIRPTRYENGIKGNSDKNDCIFLIANNYNY